MTKETASLKWYTVTLTATSSCFSILGACVIFLTYVLIPEVRNFTRKLLIFLTIADSFTAIGNLVASGRYIAIHYGQDINSTLTSCYPINWTSTVDSTSGTPSSNDTTSPKLEVLCKAQSYVTTVSNMSSFFWTFFIAVHMCWSIVQRTDSSQRTHMMVLYHFISWGVPVAIVSELLRRDYLGDDRCYGTGVWCGIKSDLHPTIFENCMYIADVAWQVTCYILTCAMYICLKLYLSKRHRRARLCTICPSLRDEDVNFLYIMLIIYVLKIWGLLRFFLTTYIPASTISESSRLSTFLEVLLNLQSYGASGQAFWNCVLFCFLDKTVRHEMGRRVCCHPERNENRPLLESCC